MNTHLFLPASIVDVPGERAQLHDQNHLGAGNLHGLVTEAKDSTNDMAVYCLETVDTGMRKDALVGQVSENEAGERIGQNEQSQASNGALTQRRSMAFSCSCHTLRCSMSPKYWQGVGRTRSIS